MRSRELSNVTEDTRDRFEEQLDIGKKIADNTKNIFNHMYYIISYNII